MAGLSSSYPVYAPVEDLAAFLDLDAVFAPGVIVWASGERVDLERVGDVVHATVYPNGVSAFSGEVKPFPADYFKPYGTGQISQFEFGNYALVIREEYIGSTGLGFAPIGSAPYLAGDTKWLADPSSYTGPGVSELAGLLERASGTVRDWTKTAVYRVDTVDGFTPTDERTRNAFHDAAILQAAGLYRAGVKPGDLVATQTAGIQSKSLGGRSVTYANDAGVSTARTELINGKLTPEAASILASNGLLSAEVQTGGGSAYDILLRRWV